MTKRRLNGARLRGRWLTFDVGDLSFDLPLGIHFGSGLKSGLSLIADTSDGRIERIVAVSECGDETLVYPRLRKRITVQHGSLGPVQLDVWLVASDLDRIKVASVIARCHYLNPPARGMFLACRFTDPDQQSRIREEAGRNGVIEDEWSNAWLEPPGDIVACASLDALFHGNPKGREEMARNLWGKAVSEKLGIAEPTRQDIVNGLGLVWASRFAVDSPYRGLGLGTVLAKELKDAARHYRAPKPRLIEVITTRPVDTAGGDDFLCAAGYTRVDHEFRSSPLLVIDPVTGNKTVKKRSCKLYYYAEL